jgi:hypothetical protein
MQLNHQVVVVTGAPGGLGRAIVREYAKRGASIVLIARGEEGLEGARRDIEAMGGRPLVLPAEVGARAVVWSSDHPRRRSLAVTASTLKVIVGSKLIPAAWLDRYAAKKGYSGQLTDEPENPSRPYDLWKPVPGDRGAHGAFDARARSRSPETWLSRHRGLLAARWRSPRGERRGQRHVHGH